MSADNFISQLNSDPRRASEIHAELLRLTASFVKQRLRLMFGRYESDDVTEIVSRTFIVVYTNNERGKELDFTNPPDSLQSYFWRIAQNLCKAFRRRGFEAWKTDSLSNEDKNGNLIQFESPDENPEERLIRREREKISQDCLTKALNNLETRKPDKYRLLFAYIAAKSKSAHEELAASIGTGSKNLAVIITRIKAALHDEVQNCLSAKGL